MSNADVGGHSPGRLGLVAAAFLALLLGLTSVASAPLSEAIAVLVEAVGYDWVVPAVLGVLALLFGLVVFVSGRGATMQQTEMPAVERPVPVPSAGEPFDETIGGWRFATRLFGGETAENVRERLRSAAVATIAAADGCSRQEARQRVEDGTWTDDGAAAAFLAGRYTPLGTWLVALTNGETGPEYRARRTVAAIRALGADEELDGTEPERDERKERNGDRATAGEVT